jgi:photosystem II stability/assembly factor-like uncharacterized protein
MKIRENTLRHHIIALLLLICAVSATSTMAQWQSSGGPFANAVYSVLPVVDSTNTKILFAGTSSGVFKLTYDGTSWNAESRGLSGMYVRSLILMNKKLYASTPNGTYWSTDEGENWTQIYLGMGINDNAYTLMVSANNIYIGTAYGMYFSNNNGASWQKIYGTDYYTYAFADDGIYLYGGATNGIYAFTNDSTNRSSVRIGLKISYTITAVAAAPYTAGSSNIFVGTAYDGIFRSTNSGTTWDSISTGLTKLGMNIRSLAVKENGSGGFNVFAGTNQGVFISTDKGNSWNPADNGIMSAGVLNVYTLTVSGNNIYAGTELGAYLSTDDGNDWTPINVRCTDTTYEVYNLAALKDKSSENHMYAGCRTTGLFLLSGKDNLWYQDNDINLNAYYPSIVWPISLCAKDTQLFIGTNSGIYSSADGGPNWIQLENYDYVLNIVCYDTLWLAGLTGSVLYSTDNGSQWQKLGASFASSDVFAIAMNEKNVYAGTASNGMYTAKILDTTWTEINNGLLNKHIYSLLLTPDGNGGTDLFAGTDYGVFMLKIGDTTWKAARTGFTGYGFYIRALKSYVTKSGSTCLFAGTYGGGVYVSKDFGASWLSVGIGFSSNGLYVNDLLVVGDSLYAGTKDGVWRRSISEILTGVEETPLNTSKKQYALEQNYPNPFNPSTVISYYVPAESQVSLKVYDVLGNEVMTLVHKDEAGGNHSVTFNARNLSSGIYFYTLRAGNYMETKKMLLLK